MVYMLPKQRMLTALNQQPTDRLPVAPIYLDLYLADEVRKPPLSQYRELMGDRKEIALQPEQEVDIQARAILEAWDTLGATPDWLCWMPLLPESKWLAECTLKREADRVWRIHKPSATVEELSQLTNTTSEVHDHWERHLPTSMDEVDALFPLRSTQEILDSGVLDALHRIVNLVGEDIFVCGGVASPYWSCYFDIGFQGLMTMPYEHPDVFQYLVERKRKDLMALCRAFKAIGIMGVFIEECMASADLVSEKFYDRFVFPDTCILLEDIHTLEMVDVFYFCGDAMPRIARLRDLKPKALAFEESKKGFQINLAEIAMHIGSDLSLFGNLDATQFKDWTEAEIEREMRQQFESTGLKQGFILSTGSPFPLDTPKEKVTQFIKLASKIKL